MAIKNATDLLFWQMLSGWGEEDCYQWDLWYDTVFVFKTYIFICMCMDKNLENIPQIINSVCIWVVGFSLFLLAAFYIVWIIL